MWGVGHFWTLYICETVRTTINQLNALDWKLAIENNAYKMDLQYLKLSFVCDISRPL